MSRPVFEADDPEVIVVGKLVEHQRFGVGRVLELEGEGANRKATVIYENAGRKQLLLKFARLRLVE